MRTAARRLLMCALIAAALAAAARPAGAQPAAPEDLVPDSTLVLIHAPNAGQLLEKLQQTSFYALYQDPAMAPAIEPLRRQAQEAFTEAMSELRLDLGEQDLPLPQGQVVVAIGATQAKVKVADMQWDPEAEEFVEAGTREEMQTVPTLLAWADMGENAPAARALIEQLARQAGQPGQLEDVQYRQESAAGIDFAVFRDDDVSLALGWQDDRLLVSAEPPRTDGDRFEQVKHLLARWQGQKPRPALGDSATVRHALRTVGAGDVVAYLNIDGLKQLAIQENPGMGPMLNMMLQQVGLDKASGVGAAVQVSPKADVDVHVRGLAASPAPRTGILAIFFPEPGPVVPGPLATRDVVSLGVWNQDATSVFREVNRMSQMMMGMGGGQTLEQQLEEAMAATGGPGGMPPVNFQQEVLSQVVGPVTFVLEQGEPQDGLPTARMMLSAGVRDANILDRAINRIHATYLPGDEMRRELRGNRLYLLPDDDEAGAVFGSPGSRIALAVVGDRLLLGPVEGIEQAIRNLNRGMAVSLRNDPLYRHAAQYLPAQASLFFYTNNDRYYGIVYEGLRAQLRQAQSDQAGEEVDDEWQEDPEVIGPGMIGQAIAEEFTEGLDPSVLPDFAQIREHFGATVGHVVGTDDGIVFEMYSLKRPPSAE